MVDAEEMTERADDAVLRVRVVYEADHARLWRSLYAFSGSRDVADEATAEAFAQALRRGREVRDVQAWIWRSAFAIARGELAARRRRGVGDAIDVPSEAMLDAPGTGLERLLDALDELPLADRELLVLCHVGGWRPAELAPMLDVSGATLRVRLHRARKRARLILEDDA
jgi:RNA polymerase sigma-70 factor (ECF subfamily)